MATSFFWWLLYFMIKILNEYACRSSFCSRLLYTCISSWCFAGAKTLYQLNTAWVTEMRELYDSGIQAGLKKSTSFLLYRLRNDQNPQQATVVSVPLSSTVRWAKRSCTWCGSGWKATGSTTVLFLANEDCIFRYVLGFGVNYYFTKH